MEDKYDDIVKWLQGIMSDFLQNRILEINGTLIQPFEIEAYYYKERVFEDEYVHCNEMQKVRNKGHFYVHRKGRNRQDAYTGGNWCCLDYVVGDEEAYFSFLLRSASVEHNDNSFLAIKPNILLSTILTEANLTKNDLENSKINVITKHNDDQIFFSTRVGLSGDSKFTNASLRAVRNGQNLKQKRYPNKEKIAFDYYRQLRNTLDIDKAKDEIRRIFGSLSPLINSYDD